MRHTAWIVAERPTPGQRPLAVLERGLLAQAGRAAVELTPAIPRAMKFLGVSGSLRHASSNTELLRAVALLAPRGLRITLFDGLGGLPHFNPDLDTDPPPPAVRVLRESIAAADGLLISSPEYAHGVPGVLKNALDWLVCSVAIVGKPIGLLNGSPRAVHAQASLVEILRTMSADVVPAAHGSVPLLGRNLDAAGIAADPELAKVVRGALTALVEAVQGRAPTASSTG